MKSISLFTLSLLLVAFVGCGNQVPLKGRVVFSDDGSPLTVGYVCLSTPTLQSRGAVDKDGYFSMATTGTNDGLPPGSYQVSIIGCTMSGEGYDLYCPVDSKWSSPETSGLTLEVDAKTKNVEIKVDRNPQPMPKSMRI